MYLLEDTAMKRKISLALLLVLLLSLTLVIFTGCGDDEEKQVPVYQGMSITKAGKSAAYLDSSIELLSDNGNGNNGNHNGHYKGDHADKNDTVDESNPYPDNEAGENIEEEIKSSLNVIGSPTAIYYATPGEDIYINIHIDNPDSFEIMSFTLNGKKYSSYMFEDGSDMETIVLKYNVGTESGIVEYTIDAIKYIDGEEIKDVVIDGDKTVMAGIRTENQVSAEVTELTIDTNSLSFKTRIKDNDSLVEFSGGALKAVIYDGFEIIAEKDLTLGENSVSFDGLKTNTLYQLAIVGYYDDLSGEGFKMNILHKDAFYTDSVVLFDNITVGQENVTFSLLWHENFAEKALASLKLYKGEKLISDLNVSAVEATKLLSNNTYKLVAEYENLGKTESIYLEFTTAAKATPEISLVNPTKTQTSVGFDINEVDTDNVGEITKIELVHKNGTVAAENLDQRAFANLLSNNAYTVKLTYVYNLNDGEGEHTVTKELDITTEAKATPEISLVNPTKTQTSVGFEINEVDTDNVGALAKIELVHKNGTVAAESLDQRAFANLLSNNAYTVKLTYVYDLNDGEGEHTVTKELSITTDTKATPEISLVNPTKTQTSVGFGINEVDTDNVGALAKIELVHKNGTVTAEKLDQRTFANLLSNNAYTVKLTYVYDLNDGDGEHTVTRELLITTDAKAVPGFTVKNENITTDSINAEYDTTDVDGILSYLKVELYKGSELISDSADNKINFTALNCYTDYTVKFTYKYNLNDGNGEQTATYGYDFKTLPYINVTECSIANTSAVSEGETIFMSVKLDNPLGMAVESVIINGETYAVTGASTTNKIFVEIVYNGQFAGGDTYLKIDKVNAKIDNTSLTVEPKTELSDNVFINGKLEVLKMEFVNEAFEPIDWAFPSEQLYVLITLDNPTGYNIDSLTQIDNWSGSKNTTSLTRLDDSRWYYTVEKGQIGETVLQLESVSYSNDYISKTLTYSSLSASCFIVTSDETVYVSSPEDLKNMNGGYYYELTQDIDLSGLEWLPNNFSGAFDGKGYSVKNMSFVGTVKNKEAHLGLFAYGRGVIHNLNLKEATVIAEVTSDDGNKYNAYCGGILALAECTTIRNCTVDKYSVFTVKNTETNYTGGLVGFAYEVTITNCYNEGTISASSEYCRIGGLVGEGNNITITSCYNTGTVSAGGDYCFTGGLIGYSSIVTITSCYNTGTVSGAHRVGGLVGYASVVTTTSSYNTGTVSASGHFCEEGGLFGYAYDATITSCYNKGAVSANGNSCKAGGLVAVSNSSTTITNCYNKGAVSANGNSCKAGGLVAESNGNTTITNCYNKGTVSSNEGTCYVGGLVGIVGWGTAISLTSCYNQGSVSATHPGGLIGFIEYETDVTIKNCLNTGSLESYYTDSSGNLYSGSITSQHSGSVAENTYSLYKGGVGGWNAEDCTLEQLSSKEFYTETLGFSEEIWDFSELDAENGKYPTLK